MTQVFAGSKCADKPADEVPKQRNHGKNLTGWFEGGRLINRLIPELCKILAKHSQILQNEVLSGPKSSDEPAEKVAKQRNHGKNLSRLAVSATDLWAAGYEWISESTRVPLLLHYDGTGWKPFDESQLQFGQLYSVVAVAADDVWALGTIGAGGSGEGLALHWNGVSWTRASFPTNSGGGFVVLESASSVASNDVWAVGNHQFYDFLGNFTENAVSYHWDGSRWNFVLESGGGSGTYSYFAGVKAIATDDVWAVGQL